MVVVFGKPFHLSDNNTIAQWGMNVNTNFLFAVYRKGTTPLASVAAVCVQYGRGGLCHIFAQCDIGRGGYGFLGVYVAE